MKKYKLYLLLVVIAFFVYIFIGNDGHRIVTGSSLEAPSLSHILGTDDLGIDIFSQLCYGGGYSIFLGGISGIFSILIGSVAGVAAGYFGGTTDKIIMSICDIINSMPQMILLILLGAFLGAGYISMILVLAFISWSHPARLVRARVIFIKNQNYIRYSKHIGAPFRIIFIKHFYPLLKELLALSFIKIMSKSIVMEASLAYLGLGNPTSKSWGMMLNRAMSFPGIYFTPFWKWWVVAPLVALMGLVLSLMLYSKEFEVSK